MEKLEAVKLDILEAGRKHGLREIFLQSIAKLLEKGKSKEEICALMDVSEKDVDEAKKWQRLLISGAKNRNKILHANMDVMTLEKYRELDRRPDPVFFEGEELEKRLGIGCSILLQFCENGQIYQQKMHVIYQWFY